MKRKALLKHLNKHNCKLLREGSNHSIFINLQDEQAALVPIPRHNTIKRFLCLNICKQLKIPPPF